MSRLKNELSWLRKKGAVRTDEARERGSCARCQTSFGLLMNRGAACGSCRQKVCKQCRQNTLHHNQWVCIVCSKQIEIQLTTGEWLNEFQKPIKLKQKPTEKATKRQRVKRSWTISSPFASTNGTDSRRRHSQSPASSKAAQDVPARDKRSPKKPVRRYSMSSIDGMAPRGRPTLNTNPHNPSPTKYYFFGDASQQSHESHGSQERRSSTLPRQPKHTSKTTINDDPTRFHSMPRTRTLQAPVRTESPSRLAALKAGFGTPGHGKTPIVSSVMNEPSPSFMSKRTLPQNPRQSRPTSRRLPETPNQKNTQPRDTSVPLQLPSKKEPSKPRQEPSRIESDDDSRREHIHRPRIPRSNTSVSTGFATTGRPSKPAPKPVRRTQSFQATASRTEQDNHKGNVAKFVLELERGIQRTCTNMTRKLSWHLPDPCKRDHSSDSVLPEAKRVHRSSQLADIHSDTSSSGLDVKKMAAEGDDYKLVFISSDSSKDSGNNTSVESEPTQPLYQNVAAKPKVTSVDIGLMTEVDSDSSLQYPDDGLSMRSTSRHSMSTLSDYTDVDEHIIPVMNLGADQMRQMLAQTKTVEEEAMALQKALMGVFESGTYTDMSPRAPGISSAAPLYENVARTSKPNKCARDMCTQTDFTPVTSDSESYYSSDDTSAPYDQSQTLPPYDRKDDKASLPPPRVSTPLATPPNSCSPSTHLQNTSERSVLLETVPVSGVLSSRYGKEECVRAPRVIYHNVIRYCEEERVGGESLKCEVSEKRNQLQSPACATQTSKVSGTINGSLSTANPTSHARQIANNLRVPTTQPNAMSSEVSAEMAAGELNAIQKVISNAAGTPSGTSDEDTDEDTHVSRSYDVSLIDQASTCKHPDDVSSDASSQSCSETDDEKPASGQYEVTLVDQTDRQSIRQSDHQVDTAATSTDLPECDQEIDTCRPLDQQATVAHSVVSDNDECIIENKSETESTLGIDNELMPVMAQCLPTLQDTLQPEASSSQMIEPELSNDSEAPQVVPSLQTGLESAGTSLESDLTTEATRVKEVCLEEHLVSSNCPITANQPLEQAVDCDEQSVLLESSCASGHTVLSSEESKESSITDANADSSDPQPSEPSSTSDIVVSEPTAVHQANSETLSQGESESVDASVDIIIDQHEDTPAPSVAMGTDLVDAPTNAQTPPIPPTRKIKVASDCNVLSESVITSSIAECVESQCVEVDERESDGPSSADSLLQGCGSESQCSDGSEEGNFISIIEVGDPSPKKVPQEKIYIRSDSTADVQVGRTCIVVTGSSGIESEGETESETNSRVDDVTILNRNKDHVMSMHVTSPESSRSASPTRAKISELQSMILSTQEVKQQYRSSDPKESSGLANYFTVTLGSESPIAHKRAAKTPEVRRRSLPDRTDRNGSHSSTPTQGATPSPTQSPAVTPTPDLWHTEIAEEPYAPTEDGIKEENIFDEFYEDDHQFDSYTDSLVIPPEESDATFDSIEDGESNFSETSSEEGYERDEEIRYCKRGYNFTLHTIIEESCEESDYDKKSHEQKPTEDPSELEKYFYFGLGNGPADPKKFANEESEYSDTFSETSSSVFSEGVDSMENCEEEADPAELASSRLEKYFSGFMGFERQPSIRSVGEESEMHTDESGSVGSDSEGSPSPEQPRKKLFRSRGLRSVSSSRSHGYSSDKGEGILSDGSHHSAETEDTDKTLVSGEEEASTESEQIAFEKTDGQFDTIKRRKKKKNLLESPDKKSDAEKIDGKLFSSESKELEEERLRKSDSSPRGSKDLSSRKMTSEEESTKDKPDSPSSEASLKIQTKDSSFVGSDLAGRKYQSRDSGFIGSSDDLLKDKPEENKEQESKESLEENDDPQQILDDEEQLPLESQTQTYEDTHVQNDGKVSRSSTGSSADLPVYIHNKDSSTSNLSRKDSFNNWSSDEETNIMMNKMRMFFKNMFSHTNQPKDVKEQKGQKIKSPQLVLFEARLTNLMRTVPGIKDNQVKEIVEYLSSEETWSDSYDSSDYTSSDLEGAYARMEQGIPELQSELQKQISVSCQQIIKKFDQGREPSDNEIPHSPFAAKAFSESSEDTSPGSKDTVFMYQRIMSSISHMKGESDHGSVCSGSQGTSPPLLAKVMHHLGNRIVALMHEVSVSSENGDDADSFNGGNLLTSSPRPKLFLPKKYKTSDSVSLDSSIDKSSLNSTSFDSEDSPTDTEQSPESESGTPKMIRQPRLSIISEKSSIEDVRPDHPRSIFGSDSQRYVYKSDHQSPHNYSSQKSLEERSAYSHQDSRNRDTEPPRYLGQDMKFSSRETQPVPRVSRSTRRPETRKAKSHMSLEKIHQEDVKNTGERSESLGDLNALDRGRSSGFSSSYEQLDSDSTLRASDSYDRHIGSSSSNVRLNASSRGSLTTSSRGSLAASSRGSLNASSKSSLHGSSGPEEDEDKKSKKMSFFRYVRRPSLSDDKEPPSREVRSTTLPRSNPIQLMPTGTLPRSQALSQPKSPSLFSSTPLYHTDRPTASGPRSARYHAPGYRPPPTTLPKRTISTPTLTKDRPWLHSDETSVCADEGVTSASVGSLSSPIVSTGSLRGGLVSSENSRNVSPLGGSLGGSLGRTSGGSLTSSDVDSEGKRQRTSDTRNASLSALGLKSRSDSLASVCSTGGDGRFASVAVVMGALRVALQYNYKEGQLECHVLQCKQLAPVDIKRNKSDAYVKAYLLPDRSKLGKRKTKVRKNTLNPIFDEVLKFSTTLSDLEERTLWLSVWHSDYFSRNEFLGQIHIPLSDHMADDSHPKWFPLQERDDSPEDSGCEALLIIGLKFVPPDSLALAGISSGSRRTRRSRGALQVRIKEANGLVGVKQSQNPPDPVCKGVLLPEKGKSSKQKTGVCRKTCNPQWNHTMVFDDVTLQELTDRGLEITIWDHDRFGGSHYLGGCRLNMGTCKSDFMDATGIEQKLWAQMVQRPNLWGEGSIVLRTILDQ